MSLCIRGRKRSGLELAELCSWLRKVSVFCYPNALSLTKYACTSCGW